MNNLREFLLSNSINSVLTWQKHLAAVEEFNISFSEVEKKALELKILPERYIRNKNTFTIEDQLKFHLSNVAIVGCGGLGCYVIEQLARLGVGNLVIIDPDTFEENNLNRQLYSSLSALGKSKVEVAKRIIKNVNPSVNVVTYKMLFTKQFGPELIQNIDIVIDALDNFKARIDLCEVCENLNIPVVHGSIAGWYGQVIVQYPGDKFIQDFYSELNISKGIEKELGNPSFAPSFVASIQVAEACKILLEKKERLQNSIISVDLMDISIHKQKIIK